MTQTAPQTMTADIKPRKPPRADLTEQELLYIPKINPNYVFKTELVTEISLDIKDRMPVMLTGHMGTGKSSLPMQMAAGMSQPVVRMNLNGQTSVSDLVGYNTVENGNVVWIDGFLTMAVRRGFWAILDEVDGASPEVLFVLNALAEKDEPKLTLKEKGGDVIVPHEKFHLFATANTVGCMEDFRHLYQGANPMNAAFIDRFSVYHIDYMDEETEIEILIKTFKCQRGAAKTFVQFANDIRTSFKEEDVDKPFSLRALFRLVQKSMQIVDREGKKSNPMGPKPIMLEAVSKAIVPKVSPKDGEFILDLARKVIPD